MVDKRDTWEWRRSSWCQNAACVEVASVDGRHLVRDSKDPDGAVLSFDETAWAAFVKRAVAGDFDI